MSEPWSVPETQAHVDREIAKRKGVKVNGTVGASAEWKEAPTTKWTPPSVVSYGAGFDAAKIPLRRWVLGTRYSRGEVTVDVGPPGTSKSTLMLSDSVQITTGRRILNDEVHVRGGVLYLAGEDSRRDIEARLAAILETYKIDPSELGGRLHIVYLAEIRAEDYTLADMVKDVATLNESMTAWLRDYPDIVMIAVDPLLAWHRLLENPNETMSVLCKALRAIAVQGDRAVVFDHHVTKSSQAIDVEGHVHNLAALRGAGSIGADARWAFTMSKLNPSTAQKFGIDADEAWRYRRLDPLKASYAPDHGEPRMLCVKSVQIANGESVGVLVEQSTEDMLAAGDERKAASVQQRRDQLTKALTMMLTERAPRSARDAAMWCQKNAAELFMGEEEVLAVETIRKRLDREIGNGLPTRIGKNPRRIVWLEKGGIDFDGREVTGDGNG